MQFITQIKDQIVGFVGTSSALFLSLNGITQIAQCVAAIMAVVIAFLTIRLTILKLKNERLKSQSHENNI